MHYNLIAATSIMLAFDSMLFQIYYQNVRGLRSKTKTIYCASVQSDFDIICLTETYLNDGVFDGEVMCDDYQVFRRDRSSTASDRRDGGGVLIATRCDLEVALMPGLCSDAEDLWVSVTCRDGCFLLCCVYLPPGDVRAFECFLSALESVSVNHPDSTILICGDFNVPRLSWSASVNGFMQLRYQLSIVFRCIFIL